MLQYVIVKDRKENYDYFAEILIYDRLQNKCVGTSSSRLGDIYCEQNIFSYNLNRHDADMTSVTCSCGI